MQARRAHRGPAWAAGVLVSCAVVLVVGACGGSSKKRQDENETEGTYRVEVLEASFPERQKLAKSSELVIRVRNADSKTIPNLAVTVHGFDSPEDNANLSDRRRPVFVINGRPKNIGGFPEAHDAGPEGCETSYVDTWACGPLKPGAERTYRWSLSAVKAGPFRLRYSVSAGLDGRAKAVDSAGSRPSGAFVGTVSDKPPETRVGDDGETVIRGTR